MAKKHLEILAVLSSLCIIITSVILVGCEASSSNSMAITGSPAYSPTATPTTDLLSEAATISLEPTKDSPEPTEDNLMVDMPALASLPQKVLVICIDPVFMEANGKRQHELVEWWNDPHRLTEQYIADMEDGSHGYAKYQIAEWHDENEMPHSTSHQSYSTKEYYDILNAALKERNDYWAYSGWRKFGSFDFDYCYYFAKYNVYEKIENKLIDEVWIFTGPCSGPESYESRMVGKNAYWCNSPPISNVDCRAFVCYVFNYERDVGCMLENAGHRFESTMAQVFGRWDYSQPFKEMNDWERFTLYDKVSSGNAACGNVHFAPNSQQDYDWGNTTKVMSTCNDWANYPQLTGAKAQVDCSTWGNGDMRLHHIWWMKQIPHVDSLNKNGLYNNWWIYFKYPTIIYH